MKHLLCVVSIILSLVCLMGCDASAPEETNGTTATPTTAKTKPTYPQPDKLIALTFDDGPNEHMRTMLDVFEQYDGKATFFVVGKKFTKRTAEFVTQAFEAGHEIGNHSFSHEDMAIKTDDEVLEEISKTQALVKEATGTEPIWYRPPFFSIGAGHHQLIQMPFAGQVVSAGDGSNDNLAEDRYYRVTNGAYDGAVVILHCNDITAEILPQILHDLKKNGYEMVTISELFARRGITPLPNTDAMYKEATP